MAPQRASRRLHHVRSSDLARSAPAAQALYPSTPRRHLRRHLRRGEQQPTRSLRHSPWSCLLSLQHGDVCFIVNSRMADNAPRNTRRDSWLAPTKFISTTHAKPVLLERPHEFVGVAAMPAGSAEMIYHTVILDWSIPPFFGKFQPAPRAESIIYPPAVGQFLIGSPKLRLHFFKKLRYSLRCPVIVVPANTTQIQLAASTEKHGPECLVGGAFRVPMECANWP